MTASSSPAPTQPGTLEAAMRLGLSGHVALGDDVDQPITQCSCGVEAEYDDLEETRYLTTHAEPPDLRWHQAHVAAVLADTVRDWETGRVEVVAEALDLYVGNHMSEGLDASVTDMATAVLAALHDPEPGERA